MYLLWIGVAAVLLKYLEIGPLAAIEWPWILAPLAGAFIWFEFLERFLGRDKRQVDHIEWEKSRKERVQKQFEQNSRARKARS